MPNLRNGVTYSILVTAINDFGESAPASSSATPGMSYRTVAATGEVSTFGTELPLGGVAHPNKPLVGGAETPSGQGYWMVASDGGIFAFGNAAYYGSSVPAGRVVVGIIP